MGETRPLPRKLKMSSERPGLALGRSFCVKEGLKKK